MAASKKQLIDRWKKEPGLSIEKRLNEWCMARAMENWRAPDSASLFALLEGLPLREEIAGGRDLRGSAFSGAVRTDLRNTDFSFARSLDVFDGCDLAGARFEEAKLTDRLKGRFVEVSFARAKLGKIWMTGCTFERCDFTGADLRGTMMRDSTYTASTFRGADLSRADLQNSDLRGCDFTGAKLDAVMFRQVTLDGTTDLRGASLVGVINEEQRDFAGKLVLRGTDWRKAKWDESTKTGPDAAGSEDLLLIDLIIRKARAEGAPWAAPLVREAERLKGELAKNPKLRWYDALMATVPPKDQAAVGRFLERATLDFV